MLLWCQVNCPKISAWRWIKYCLISIQHPCQSMEGGGREVTPRRFEEKGWGTKESTTILQMALARVSQQTSTWVRLNPCCTLGLSCEMSSVLQCEHRWDWSPVPKKERGGDCAFEQHRSWFFTKAKVEAGTYLLRQCLCYHCFVFSAFLQRKAGSSWLVIVVGMISR